jgi:branched-subunit amino acid ABC-type transport system permease component
MAYATLVGIEFIYAFAALVLVSLGLAVIFGMMRIINLAHGEFIVLGSYAAILASRVGADTWFACLVVAPIAVAFIGLLLERLIMRHLYGRLVETMLATWGLSLFITGLLTLVFGTATSGVSVPVGPVAVGPYQTSGYNLAIIAVTFLAVGGLYILLRRTRFGLLARGTMQNPEMAAALGVNTSTVYSATFALGAGLAGLAGGVLAPVTGVFPTVGGAYIGKAFITVISGGASIIAGTASASALLATVGQVATFLSNQVFGEVVLLLAALVIIRFLPNGITSRFFRRSL